MDTNRDLGIMSHVGHLRRTPEFVTGNGLRIFFLVTVKFHQVSQILHLMSYLWNFQLEKMDYGLWNIPVTSDPEDASV